VSAQAIIPARQLRQTAALAIQHRNGRLVHVTVHQAYVAAVLAVVHHVAQALAGAVHHAVVLAVAIRVLAAEDKFKSFNTITDYDVHHRRK